MIFGSIKINRKTVIGLKKVNKVQLEISSILNCCLHKKCRSGHRYLYAKVYGKELNIKLMQFLALVTNSFETKIQCFSSFWVFSLLLSFWLRHNFVLKDHLALNLARSELRLESGVVLAAD